METHQQDKIPHLQLLGPDGEGLSSLQHVSGTS